MIFKHFISSYHRLIRLIPKIYYTVIDGYIKYQNNRVYTTKDIRRKIMFVRDQLTILHGRWTIEVLYAVNLLNNCSFNDILNDILPGINSKTLSNRLKFLEKKGLIKRKVIANSPIRVLYEITEFGDQAIALLFPFIFLCALPKNLRRKTFRFKTVKSLNLKTNYQPPDAPEQIE